MCISLYRRHKLARSTEGMGRAPCCEKLGLKRGKWTEEEDDMLASYIARHGEGSWRSLPKNAGLLRCGKSCRLRWLNYLRDGVRRGSFSKEEDDLIVKLHATLGKRWSLIASHLPGRTDNEIKNYWKSHLSRQFHSFWQTYTAINDATITIDINKLFATAKRRASGAPCPSPRSNMKKQPVPETTKARDGSCLISATSSATSLPQGDLDQNQTTNNNSVNHTSGEPCIVDGISPVVRHPVDQNGRLPEPNRAVDQIGLCKASNTTNQIGILDHESEMEAMSPSIDMPPSGLMGIEHGVRSKLEDLLDMDMDWEGFASHLRGQPTKNDMLQTTKQQETTGFEAGNLESFVSWLLSDAC